MKLSKLLNEASKTKSVDDLICRCIEVPFRFLIIGLFKTIQF